MNNKEKFLIGALGAALIVVSVLLLVQTWRIRNVGRILSIGIEVYQDAGCTMKCELIDWGLMRPGDVTGVTIYVLNSQTANFTLSLNTTNWTPPQARDYLTLSWNYTGAIIKPGEVIPVQLMLYADVNVTGVTDFTFNTVITATEA